MIFLQRSWMIQQRLMLSWLLNNALKRWRTALFNRRQELLKEEKMKEKQEKALGDDLKSLASKENIQVCLRGPSNFLA